MRFNSIYCDMDQVLVNFLKSTKRIFGKEFNDPCLGSSAEKWAKLYEIPGFWTTLDWMPRADVLWNHIKDHDTYILSACPPYELYPTSAEEKTQWCIDNLGIDASRVHTVDRKDKQKFAVTNGSPNLLIDDHPKNAAEWTSAGGIVILHHNVPETIAELKKLGI